MVNDLCERRESEMNVFILTVTLTIYRYLLHNRDCIVIKNRLGDPSLNSERDLVAFHIVLIPLEKWNPSQL